MRKIKLTILSLLILPLLAGCFLLPQNGNTNQPVNANQGGEIDTSDLPSEDLSQEGWKTYRNEEHGFEFKYPGDWDILEEVEADPWFKVVVNDNLSVSNLPIGFENTQPLDQVDIDGVMYDRLWSDRISYKQHIIMLDDGYYIVYSFDSTSQLEELEAIIMSFKKIDIEI